MTIILALLAYAASMIVANLTIAHFGPVVAPVNAFFLIGLDLALRDWLHVRVKVWQMGALIAGTSVLTYLLNPTAQTIAIASAASFALAALADWLVFSKVRGSWATRSNVSNVAGAAVDSMLFPTLAFGALMPQIVLMQFAAKAVGGAVWTFLLRGRNPPQELSR